MISAINIIPLRPGVAPEQFERFAAEVDQPACLAHEVVERMDTYVVERRIAGQAAVPEIVEIMTVRSWEDWVAVRDSDPELLEVGRQFAELAYPARVTTVLARRVEA